MRCKVCGKKSEEAFSKLILAKYEVKYFQCSNCNFIQTEEPFWLDQAYSSGAISALDTGIISRNLLIRERTKNILLVLFSNFSDFIALDFGGGEGIFVRMMRDIGYNFYRYDLYADNLYSRFFDIKDLPQRTKFDILTAFEVFEHLVDPVIEIENMFCFSDIILLSTELQPSKDIEVLSKWWYIAEESGQHVSFYSKSSFLEIAKMFDCFYYSNSKNLHILSKKKLQINPFTKEEKQFKSKRNFGRIVTKLYAYLKLQKRRVEEEPYSGPESLTLKDFYFVKQKLRKKKE